MNKTSFREQIDLEMKDVHLSPERIRRIHNQTDRKRARGRARHRARKSRWPAALLSLAVAACAVFALFNSANISRLFGPNGEAPEPENTFEAAGVRFTVDGVLNNGELVLCWKVSSGRNDQALAAFTDFEIVGAESMTPPEALNGLDGMTALGGDVQGMTLPKTRAYSVSLPVAAVSDQMTLRATMRVYAPLNAPRMDTYAPAELIDYMMRESPGLLDSDDYERFAAQPDDPVQPCLWPEATPEPTLAPMDILEELGFPVNDSSTDQLEPAESNADESAIASDTARTIQAQLDEIYRLAWAAGDEQDCLAALLEAKCVNARDAIEDGELVLDREGLVTRELVDELVGQINVGSAFWNERNYDVGTLELAEKCGLIEPLGEAQIELPIEADSLTHLTVADNVFESDRRVIVECDMTALRFWLYVIVEPLEDQKLPTMTGELSREYVPCFDREGTRPLYDVFSGDVGTEYPSGAADEGMYCWFDWQADNLSLLNAMPESIYLVPRITTFYDRPGQLLPEEAIELKLVPLSEE